MSKILIVTILYLSSMFIFVNHPLSFGVLLLAQTLMVSLMTGLMSLNFWFSYILFLIMVGGMLIMFIYMTSVASNEKFKLSMKLVVISIIPMMFTALYFLDPMMLNMLTNNHEMTASPKFMNLPMSKYMNNSNHMLMFLMITYLLISLIMVVKITNVKYGPLRQKF